MSGSDKEYRMGKRAGFRKKEWQRKAWDEVDKIVAETKIFLVCHGDEGEDKADSGHFVESEKTRGTEAGDFA
jgi:hypothetical protein